MANLANTVSSVVNSLERFYQIAQLFSVAGGKIEVRFEGIVIRRDIGQMRGIACGFSALVPLPLERFVAGDISLGVYQLTATFEKQSLEIVQVLLAHLYLFFFGHTDFLSKGARDWALLPP